MGWQTGIEGTDPTFVEGMDPVMVGGGGGGRDGWDGIYTEGVI
jgi:hypothetical protein